MYRLISVLCISLTYIAMFNSTVHLAGVGSLKLSVTTAFNCNYHGVTAEKWRSEDSWAH